MAPRPQFDPQYLDEHHQRIVEFADEYMDDPDEHDALIDTLLERRGYTRTSGWASPPPPGAGPPAPTGGSGPAARPRPAYFRK